MSEQKRAELIAAGRLHADGSRKERCPTCGHELTAEEYAAINPSGSAVGQPEAVNPGVTDPNA